MLRDLIVHIRPICKKRKVMFNNKPKYKISEPIGYTYKSLSNEDKENNLCIGSNGGITVALIKHENLLKMGIAKCNEHDTYSKSIGRTIAIGRANKKPFITNDVEFDQIHIKLNKVVELLQNKRPSEVSSQLLLI